MQDVTSDEAQASERKMINVIVTENQRLVLLQNGHEIYNEMLSLQIPEISAVYGTATMEVVNNTAYIGGFNGTVYRLHISVDGGHVSVNVSTVELNLPCIPEVFAHTGSSVITACFGHSVNRLYFVNIDSPDENAPLKFTNTSDLSNIVAVNGVFYFAQSNHLFRGDTGGQRVVETLQNCIQPLLLEHKGCCLIIQCPDKSYVFVPPEWGSAPGFWEGSWEDKKPYPCYGVGSVPLIFSYEGAEITFYDIRNNFKHTIKVNGAPDPSTFICVWSNNDPVLFYKENLRCNCWIRHTMSSNLEYTNSTEIPSSHGTLRPLSTSKGDIDQGVLLFYPDILRFLMLPSANQVMVDVRTDFVYTNITSRVVLYHGMVHESKSNNENTGKQETNDKSTRESHDWTAYVAVGVGIAILVMIAVVGSIGYLVWRRHRHRSGNRTEITSNEVVVR